MEVLSCVARPWILVFPEKIQSAVFDRFKALLERSEIVAEGRGRPPAQAPAGAGGAVALAGSAAARQPARASSLTRGVTEGLPAAATTRVRHIMRGRTPNG